MSNQLILLRFGELTLKGRNRHRFEQAILTHIERILHPFSGTRIVRTSGRVLIELNGAPYEEVALCLHKVFGLSSFSPVTKTALELEAMQQEALRTMQSIEPAPETFKVTVRRAYKSFPYDSQQLNHLIASYVLRRMKQLKVNVRQPEAVLQVEVREEGAYVYSQVEKGLGGFPAGTSGKAMLMLSGGIDSPVAGWLAMKRGLRLEAVHFHSYPYTSERAKQKVLDLAAKLADYAGEVKVHLVHFTDIQTRLRTEGKEHLLITLMRRAMMRITERLAQKHDAAAIVTGENLGQVASQTLPSLNAIGQVVNMPVLRPLITMDKDEIIRIAEQIDTYSTSILPYEDCCTIFVPKNPATNPNLKVIAKIEEHLPWLQEAIDDAVKSVETLQIGSSLHVPGVRNESASDDLSGQRRWQEAEIDELL